MTNLVVTLAAAAYFGFGTRQLNLGWIYDSYVPLMSAAIALSIALSAGAVLAHCAMLHTGSWRAMATNKRKALWH